MAYASMTPEEVELRIQELMNREKRINLREAEVENQTRNLQDREQQLAAASAHAYQSNVDPEKERVLLNRLAENDKIMREKAIKENQLLEKIQSLENAIAQNAQRDELHTRSFINSTSQEQYDQSNPFIMNKEENHSERSNPHEIS